jgi:hypothetical protein
MRTYLKDIIKPLIPESVRNSIKEVTKKQQAHYTTGKSYTQTTHDDVWIPKTVEVLNTNSLGYGLFTNSDNSRIKNKTNTGEVLPWWLRDDGGTDRFCCVSDSGSISSDAVVGKMGVCLGFCT